MPLATESKSGGLSAISHPVTAAEALRWFQGAGGRGPMPQEKHVAHIVHYVNVTMGQPGRMVPPPLPPEAKRTKSAIRALMINLPQTIATAEALAAAMGCADHENVKKLHRLHRAVLDASTGVFHIPYRARDSRAWWHATAETLADFATAAYVLAGRHAPSKAKPTAPLIKVVKAALERMGINEEPDAIVSALRKRPTSPRQVPRLSED